MLSVGAYSVDSFPSVHYMARYCPPDLYFPLLIFCIVSPLVSAFRNVLLCLFSYVLSLMRVF